MRAPKGNTTQDALNTQGYIVRQIVVVCCPKIVIQGRVAHNLHYIMQKVDNLYLDFYEGSNSTRHMLSLQVQLHWSAPAPAATAALRAQ